MTVDYVFFDDTISELLLWLMWEQDRRKHEALIYLKK